MNNPLSMIDTLGDFVSRIESLGLEYMVTGSFAMSSYVPARTTIDIDIILEISDADAVRFEQKFGKDYYVDSNAIRRAVQAASMFNIISFANAVKLDCIVRKRGDFDNEAFKRRRRVTIDNISFWTISKDDLIVSKLRWAKGSHSVVQIRDISWLLESGFDREYVKGWVDKLQLAEIWSEVERWKTRAKK